MELRTTFNITPSSDKISYSDPVLFIGSCFSTYIGSKLGEGRMTVMINPSGTVYNPVSVCNTLDSITAGREYVREDLHNNKGIWLSFSHNTDFSSASADTTLNKINKGLTEAVQFLTEARYLFVTFGTARVYRWKQSGKIVSNCHKLQSDYFTHELLDVKNIIEVWNRQLTTLREKFPGLKVVFTVSPVRHWKDGAHGNQVSKSVLFVAIEELLKHPSCPGYFPAYELLMDDLRDYRFYDNDMIHPSGKAIDYIWEAFSACYFDRKTLDLYREVSKITEAVNHNIRSDLKAELTEFSGNMILRIDSLTERNPGLDLSEERDYFLRLAGS